MTNMHAARLILSALIATIAVAGMALDVTTASESAAGETAVHNQPEMRLLSPQELGDKDSSKMEPAADSQETTIIASPIDPENFIRIVRPLLRNAEQVSPVQDRHVAITGSRETIAQVSRLAGEIAAAVGTGVHLFKARVLLLSSDAADSTPGETIEPQRLGEVLAPFGVTEADIGTLPITGTLYRLGDAVFPVDRDSTVRTQLSETMELYLELKPAEKERLAATLTLAQSGPIVRKDLLVNDFEATPGKPVIIGMSHATRTLLLVLRFE